MAMSDAVHRATPVCLPRSSGASIGQIIEEASQAIEGARSTDELYAYFGSFSRQIGFDYFSYFASDQLRLGYRPATDPMAGTSYPACWRTRYLRLGYQHNDPVLRAATTMRRPFTWGDCDFVNRLEGKSRQMFEEARAFGIGGGISIPVHGPTGNRGLLSLSCREYGVASPRSSGVPSGSAPRRTPDACRDDGAAAAPERDEIRLTEQERECLTWTFRGKTAWGIARTVPPR
jgi:hypothetical protein